LGFLDVARLVGCRIGLAGKYPDSPLLASAKGCSLGYFPANHCAESTTVLSNIVLD